MTNIKLVSKKLIKPCTPTPQNLKNYKLSFIDEVSPQMEVGVILFYPLSNKKRSCLEESLAKILVQFYPLAGRYNSNDCCVDCSDQGAGFVIAEALEIELIDLIAERNLEKLEALSPPCNRFQENEATDPLLSIQITKFKCGGLAISISVPHRIFDASSLETFIAAWSNANKSELEGKFMMTISPNFDSPSFFPAKNQRKKVEESKTTETSKSVVRKFSFNKESITSLISNLRPDHGKQRIPRLRVVTALIAKALIGLDEVKQGGESRPCIVVQAVNIRGRTTPPLPKHSCGNMVILSPSRCMDAIETKDMGIQELVRLLGDAIDKSVADCGEIMSAGEEGLSNIIIKPVADAYRRFVSEEANVIWFSDWSKFGFYEADFGWGKPVWASIVEVPGSNFVVFMEKKEGTEIEAWVNLDKTDMLLFEQDEEIRFFTS
ncbi:hypothetical protein C2S52_015250 [Perilla frutescens var. hirtella]|nr:hypothetical protein C2S52_015250 [Perilla frutescens var. hirtella]